MLTGGSPSFDRLGLIESKQNKKNLFSLLLCEKDSNLFFLFLFLPVGRPFHTPHVLSREETLQQSLQEGLLAVRDAREKEVVEFRPP